MAMWQRVEVTDQGGARAIFRFYIDRGERLWMYRTERLTLVGLPILNRKFAEISGARDGAYGRVATNNRDSAEV
jgi:hypothetical protein